ncbi:hypothetical protein UFOVP434_32 [uncultured Caudovirales phage]|uniref:dATP/dGTP diphosphohydrolase N-terminal domain-containing protein n=1 Tax=uncultured Caudovirales phage TaxID=2100421 RepID=A0A6J5MBL4_9CAUD|nr:hypothetical protein UFOVP434_32 [uncultured Caudovirales phage]
MENYKNYNETRGLKPFYMGIPIEVLRRIGDTYREGFYKYDEQNPWTRYYQKEMLPNDFLEVFNNAVEHLFNGYDEIANGNIHEGGEDHLAHAVVNLCMIIWATEKGFLPNKLRAVQGMIETKSSSSEEIQVELTPKVEELPTVAEKVGKSILDVLNLRKKANS